MEGVDRYRVRLLPHSLKWEEEYEITKNILLSCWKSNILDIQHVGSTAIKNIQAKPILDIAIKLQSIEDMDVTSLTNLGYDYRGPRPNNANYHLFVLRGSNQISLHHIHCYDASEEEFDLLVGFRDYLNSHPEEALQYETLKLSLVDRYPDDRRSYTDGKEDFIHSIYQKIRN